MSNTTRSQKIGWVIFALGGLYMFGLGWLYSWRVVGAANQVDPHAYFNLLGSIWAWSVPLGAFIVATGAALTAKAERRIQWLLGFQLFRTIGIPPVTSSFPELNNIHSITTND